MGQVEWGVEPLDRVLEAVAAREGDAIRRFLDLADTVEREALRGATSSAREIVGRAVAVRHSVIDAIVRTAERRQSGLRFRELVDRHGAGFVLRVRNEGSEQDLAVKVHITAPLPSPKRLEAVALEKAASVGGWTPPMHALGARGPFFYVVRDFVSGDTLGGQPVRRPRSALEGAFLVRAVAAAADSLWEEGVRCELTPSRLVVDFRDKPHILDCGFLRACLESLNVPLGSARFTWGCFFGSEDPGSRAANVRVLGDMFQRLLGGQLEESPREIRELCRRAVLEEPENRPTLEDFVARLDEILVPHVAVETEGAFSSSSDDEIERIKEQIAAASQGRYEDLRLINRGGMGLLLLGRDTSLDVLRMIKVPLRQRSSRATRVEVQRLAKLRHDHIVTVHEFTATDAISYFVMDFLPGLDLGQLLSRGESGRGAARNALFSPRVCATLVRDISRAVDYLHSRRPPVIHYDVKPENIQVVDLDATAETATPGSLSRSGLGSARSPSRWKAVLLDFGLSRRLEEAPPEFGTRDWVAPERLADGALGPVGPSSDVWNLGALLYDLLTGGAPAGTLRGSAGTAGRPRRRAVRIPRRLTKLCALCLEEHPSRRPSAKAVADSLQRYLDGIKLWRVASLALLAAIVSGILGLLVYVTIRPPVLTGAPQRWFTPEGNLLIALRGQGIGDEGSRVFFAGEEVTGFDVSGSSVSIVLDPDVPPLLGKYGPQPVRVEVPNRLSSNVVHVHVPVRLRRSAMDFVSSRPRAAVIAPDLFGPRKPGLAVANSDHGAVALFRWTDGLSLEFQREVSVPGGSPLALVLVDIDRDGTSDLVVATEADLVCWLNRGGGRFAARRIIERSVVLGQRSVPCVLAGDFNSDTYLDVALSDNRGFRIFENLEGGDLSPDPVLRRDLHGIQALVAADLEGRGRGHDLVAIIEATHGVELWSFTRKSAFAEERGACEVSGTSYAMTAADFDGDGVTDVAVGFRDEVSLYEWDPTRGRFQRCPRSIRPFPSPVTRMAAGDFNRDGNPDIVVMNDHDRYADCLSVALNDRGDEHSLFFSTPRLYPAATQGKPLSLDVGSAGVRGSSCVAVLAPNELVLREAEGGDLHDRDSMRAGEDRSAGGFLGPRDLGVADLDGNGIPDLITANSAHPSIAVFFGGKDGFSRKPKILQLGAPHRYPRFVKASHLDDDGALDIVTLNRDSRDLTILWGPVDPSSSRAGEITPLRIPNRQSPPGEPRAFCLADLDGDGNLDIAVTVIVDHVKYSGELVVFYGKGKRAFECGEPTAAGIGPRMIAAGDLDGDGGEDLIVACEGDGGRTRGSGNTATDSPAANGGILILLHEGGGRFSPKWIPAVQGSAQEPEFLVVDEFTGDSIPDLFVSCDEDVFLLPGKGAGEFTAFDEVEPLVELGRDLGSDPEFARAIDIDHDGDLDVLVCDENTDRGVVTIENTGGGAFRVREPYLPVDSAQALALLETKDSENWVLHDCLAVVSRGGATIDLFPRGPGGFLEKTRRDRLKVEAPQVEGGPDGIELLRYDGKGPGSPDTLVVVNEDQLCVEAFRRHGLQWKEIEIAGRATGERRPKGTKDTDINGDGVTDLIVHWEDLSRQEGFLSVLVGQTDRVAFHEDQGLLPTDRLLAPLVLATRVWMSGASQPRRERLDFDDDGRPDLAVASRNALHIFLNDKGERFHLHRRHELTGLATPVALLAGDLDGDRTPELVIIGAGADGDGGLQQSLVVTGFLDREATVQRMTVREPGVHAALGNFNGDGLPDLAILHKHSVSLHVGTRRDERRSVVVHDVGESLAAILPVDVDRDGVDDLLVADSSGQGVLLLLNDSHGTFVKTRRFPGGTRPEALTAGDFTGPEGHPDGFVEFVVANGGYGVRFHRVYP